MAPDTMSDLAAFMCFASPFFFGTLSLWLALYYRHRGKELEVRMFEAQARTDQARLLAGAPDWVDPSDPADFEAWREARGEVARITTKPTK